MKHNVGSTDLLFLQIFATKIFYELKMSGDPIPQTLRYILLQIVALKISTAFYRIYEIYKD
jgi:hypothetical protein